MKLEYKGQLTDAILQTVREQPNQTATQVAHALDHSPATVSGMLARLSAEGRIDRHAIFEGPRHCPGVWHYFPAIA